MKIVKGGCKANMPATCSNSKEIYHVGTCTTLQEELMRQTAKTTDNPAQMVMEEFQFWSRQFDLTLKSCYFLTRFLDSELRHLRLMGGKSFINKLSLGVLSGEMNVLRKSVYVANCEAVGCFSVMLESIMCSSLNVKSTQNLVFPWSSE